MEDITTTLAGRSENLRQAIEERIVTGVYAPGRRLDEQELAASFGVSRTPIREALIQLGSVGLLEVRPRRGATVPEMSAERLCEMFEVMAGLEAMCGRLAARRIQPIELAALQQAHQSCASARAAGDCDLYYQHNEAFHRCLYEAGHNTFLAEQAPSVAGAQPDGRFVLGALWDSGRGGGWGRSAGGGIVARPCCHSGGTFFRLGRNPAADQ